MDFNQIGDSIECLKSEVIAKFFNRGRLKTHPKNNRRYFALKCERSGTAEIIKELNPKTAVINSNSNLNIGDKVCGDKLELFIDQLKRPKLKHIGSHTSSHGSQQIITEKYTYAQITKPYDTIPFEIKETNELE